MKAQGRRGKSLAGKQAAGACRSGYSPPDANAGHNPLAFSPDTDVI